MSFEYVIAAVVAATLMFTPLTSGRRGLPVVIALSLPLLLGPIATLMLFPDVNAPRTMDALIVFSTALALPFLIPTGQPKVKSLEQSISDSRGVRQALTVMFLIAASSSVYITYRLVTEYSVTSLYGLNVAYAEKNLPSFGVLGRISRLSMPIGLIAATLAHSSSKTSTRRIYWIIVAGSILSLLGVRRSTLFYEVGFLSFLWLLRSSEVTKLRKLLPRIAIIVTTLLAFFGFIQIQTHKSSSDSIIGASVNEGLLYLGGNIPYSECIMNSPGSVGAGFSFPFFSYLKSALTGVERGDYSKPMCLLQNEQLFNTSPAYGDIWLDYGPLAVALFGFTLGLLLWLGIRGTLRFDGITAILLTALCLTARENMLGMLDVIQSLVAYPAIVMMLIVVGERTQATDSRPRKRRPRR